MVVYGFSGGAQLKAVLGQVRDLRDRPQPSTAAAPAEEEEAAGEVGGTLRLLRPGAQAGGASNWTCLRYETPLQAEKALCQHGTFLGARGGFPPPRRGDARGCRPGEGGGPGGSGGGGPPSRPAPPALSRFPPPPRVRRARAILVEEDVLLGRRCGG